MSNSLRSMNVRFLLPLEMLVQGNKCHDQESNIDLRENRWTGMMKGREVEKEKYTH